MYPFIQPSLREIIFISHVNDIIIHLKGYHSMLIDLIVSPGDILDKLGSLHAS